LLDKLYSFPHPTFIIPLSPPEWVFALKDLRKCFCKGAFCVPFSTFPPNTFLSFPSPRRSIKCPKWARRQSSLFSSAQRTLTPFFLSDQVPGLPESHVLSTSSFSPQSSRFLPPPRLPALSSFFFGGFSLVFYVWGLAIRPPDCPTPSFFARVGGFFPLRPRVSRKNSVCTFALPPSFGPFDPPVPFGVLPLLLGVCECIDWSYPLFSTGPCLSGPFFLFKGLRVSVSPPSFGSRERIFFLFPPRQEF